MSENTEFTKARWVDGVLTVVCDFALDSVKGCDLGGDDEDD